MNAEANKSTIVVNGETRQLEQPVKLERLLTELEFTTKALAVEVNLQLVPRAEHAEFEVKPGDALEIVTLAGGG